MQWRRTDPVEQGRLLQGVLVVLQCTLERPAFGGTQPVEPLTQQPVHADRARLLPHPERQVRLVVALFDGSDATISTRGGRQHASAYVVNLVDANDVLVPLQEPGKTR